MWTHSESKFQTIIHQISVQIQNIFEHENHWDDVVYKLCIGENQTACQTQCLNIFNYIQHQIKHTTASNAVQSSDICS